VSVALLVLVGLPSAVILLHPLVVALARRAWDRLARATEAPAPAVSVVIPLAATEEHLARNLDRVLRQRGLAAYQVILVAEDRDQPAAARARAAVAAHPEVETAVVYSGDPRGRLAKMHNLRAGLRLCRHPIVVFVDSDATFDGEDDLRRLVRPLADERVGLVTAVPVYRAPRTLGGALTAAMINADLRACLACLYLAGSLNAANGAALAMRRSLLAEIGDLGDFERRLLSDTALARRVRAAGRRVALCADPVVVLTPAMSLADWWRQAMRWHIGMRRVLPAGEYALYGYRGAGLALGVIAYLLTMRPWLLAVPLLARVICCATLALGGSRERRVGPEVFLVLATDLLTPVIWLLSWARADVRWRKRAYRIGRDGEARELARG
jgi:cellulose synthase/poly-beta-1,6-N-acetylglucosamine synthase-like glycosyltransferase